jgi:hypothetical protein
MRFERLAIHLCSIISLSIVISGSLTTNGTAAHNLRSRAADQRGNWNDGAQ